MSEKGHELEMIDVALHNKYKSLWNIFQKLLEDVWGNEEYIQDLSNNKSLKVMKNLIPYLNKYGIDINDIINEGRKLFNKHDI